MINSLWVRIGSQKVKTIPIESYPTTVWLVKFYESSESDILWVWHKSARIEEIVKAANVHFPDLKFTVSAVSVGQFRLEEIDHSLTNGRKVNQDFEVVI